MRRHTALRRRIVSALRGVDCVSDRPCCSAHERAVLTGPFHGRSDQSFSQGTGCKHTLQCQRIFSRSRAGHCSRNRVSGADGQMNARPQSNSPYVSKQSEHLAFSTPVLGMHPKLLNPQFELFESNGHPPKINCSIRLAPNARHWNTRCTSGKLQWHAESMLP